MGVDDRLPWTKRNSFKLFVLFFLCVHNSVYTVLRRYSQGILKETYSINEVLLLGEVIKMIVSVCVMSTEPLLKKGHLFQHLTCLARKSKKMLILALMYWIMNILSFVALQFIGAATFTILSQSKVFTTAAFSSLMLHQMYSWGKWRALLQLVLGVLLFSAPLFENDNNTPDQQQQQWQNNNSKKYLALVGTVCVLLQMTLSGFSSIYFEKAIKSDTNQQLTIWECNFQIALGSLPIYCIVILWNKGGEEGYGGGWSYITLWLSILGSAGGLLVALSIKYSDSIMKTLAVTGSIVLSSYLDHVLLSGPMNMIMIIAASQVILAICNYTFDSSSPNIITMPAQQQRQQQPCKLEISSSQAKSATSRSRAFNKLEEGISLIDVELKKESEEL